MAAANPAPFLPLFFFLLLSSSPDLAFSQISPSPSPLSIYISPSSTPSPSPISPSPFNALSPPSPIAGDEASRSPSPSTSPSPAPAQPNEFQKSADVSADDNEKNQNDSGSSWMSGGKKAGIAIGVLAAVALVGLGALVYKKRQENIRRSRYGYNARMMEMI